MTFLLLISTNYKIVCCRLACMFGYFLTVFGKVHYTFAVVVTVLVHNFDLDGLERVI